MIIKPLQESFISNFQYNIPKSDPEKLLYDFYFITTFLSGTRKEDPEVDFVFKESVKGCVDNLYEHMLLALKWSLCAEFRHLSISYADLQGLEADSSSYEDEEDKKNQKSLFKKIKPKFLKFFKVYKKHRLLFSDYDFVEMESKYKRYYKTKFPEILKDSNSERIEGRQKTYSTSYYVILKTQKELGLSNLELAEIFYFGFKFPYWNGGYGGSAWANIAKGWEYLLKSKTLNEKIIYIDHAYDLQHNNGSVFTKVKLYTGESDSLSWLNNTLNWKRDVTDIRTY